MRLCFTAIDDAFAYDDDDYYACVLFCFIKLCYNMYNLTKLIKYFIYTSFFSKSSPIYDFDIYIRFTTDFGIYSILEHKKS